MAQEYHDYQCTIPHHEYEEMKLSMEKRPNDDEFTVCIEVPDGGGHSNNASRVTITFTELCEIIFIANRFNTAQAALKGGETKQ